MALVIMIEAVYLGRWIQHRFDVGETHGIVHIRSRLVRDPGAGLRKQSDFRCVHVDGVSDDGLRPQNTGGAESCDGTHA